MHDESYLEVYQFWFQELQPKQWWQKSAELDALIKKRFANHYQQAKAAELAGWRAAEQGRLAEIIVLDQLPRNMFRNRPEAFATDSLAVVLSQEAVAGGADKRLTAEERVFLYMPLMHSESLVVHQQAEQLYKKLAVEHPAHQHNYEFEQRHRVIIERFGRYPHRNSILGRQSTDSELEFLSQPGSSF